MSMRGRWDPAGAWDATWTEAEQPARGSRLDSRTWACWRLFTPKAVRHLLCASCSALLRGPGPLSLRGCSRGSARGCGEVRATGLRRAHRPARCLWGSSGAGLGGATCPVGFAFGETEAQRRDLPTGFTPQPGRAVGPAGLRFRRGALRLPCGRGSPCGQSGHHSRRFPAQPSSLPGSGCTDTAPPTHFRASAPSRDVAVASSRSPRCLIAQLRWGSPLPGECPGGQGGCTLMGAQGAEVLVNTQGHPFGVRGGFACLPRPRSHIL